MKVKGVIDSLNFSSGNLEVLFKNSENYSIEPVKSIGVFEPKLWLENFNKPLTKNIVEAKILNTYAGLTLPIKRYSVSQTKQTLEFAGLHGYNDKSKYLSELLKEIWEHIQEEKITRLDVAIDFKGKIPLKVIKKLCKDREPFKFWNTIYYKTKKEKRTNTTLNIKTYNKSRRINNLTQEVQRLEFSFQGQYLQNMTIKDLDKAFQKMEKTIKKFSGLDVLVLVL